MLLVDPMMSDRRKARGVRVSGHLKARGNGDLGVGATEGEPKFEVDVWLYAGCRHMHQLEPLCKQVQPNQLQATSERRGGRPLLTTRKSIDNVREAIRARHREIEW